MEGNTAETCRKHLFGSNIRAEIVHARNVSNLAYEVGREMGLGDEACSHLAIAGYFHDIGKAELNEEPPQNTLLVEEMNSLRLHPQKGYETLKRHGYAEDICEAVLYHHENRDGSGYPGRLSDGAIPRGACILRVCDVFCALVQERPYRGAFSPEVAMHMMIEEVEKYDMEVFLAFQRVVHNSPDGSVQLPAVSEAVRGVWSTL